MKQLKNWVSFALVWGVILSCGADHLPPSAAQVHVPQGALALSGAAVAGPLDHPQVSLANNTGKLQLGARKAKSKPLTLTLFDTKGEALPIMSHGGVKGGTCQLGFAMGQKSAKAELHLHDDGTFSLDLPSGVGGLQLDIPLDFGVLPSRFMDCTWYNPADYKTGTQVYVPPEQMVMGLADKGNRTFVATWPKGVSEIYFTRDQRGFSGMHFGCSGPVRLHLALWDTQDLWHHLSVKGLAEEKEIALDWTPPHKARWVTKLYEAGLQTTYEMGPAKKKANRPGLGGAFDWPFYLKEEKPVFFFSRRIPAKEYALIYALDGHEKTPFAFMAKRFTAKETQNVLELARVKPQSQIITDKHNIKPIDHSGWHQACRGRDTMKATFLSSFSFYRDRDFIGHHVEIRRQRLRIPELHFADYKLHLDQLKSLVEAGLKEKSHANRVAYLQDMDFECKDVKARWDRAMEDKTTPWHLENADRMAARFQEVLAQDPRVLRERAVELKQLIRDINHPLNRSHRMGGKTGWGVRRWFQNAALKMAQKPQAAADAVKIRQIIRELFQYRRDECVTKVKRDMRKKEK